MELAGAIELIIKGMGKMKSPQVWADLGAGSGLFSQALSQLLPDGSIIYAVDKSYQATQSIKSLTTANKIITLSEDFTSTSLAVPSCNGLLMANSLHFVKDKLTFLQQIRRILQPDGRIIIVEYDTDASNHWVPWPISCKNLHKLLTKTGMGRVKKIGEQPSSYQSGGIYSALIVD